MRFVLLILFPFTIEAQNLPITGEVHADSSFVCIDWLQSDSSAFGVKEICNSENFIEIRLTTHLMGSSELLILSFKNKEWVAEKHSFNYVTKKRKVISVIPKKEIRKDSAALFTTIFENLKSNRVFLLPDQKNLKKEEGTLIITHGRLYRLSFKAGNSFRRYSYSNPERFTEYFPAVMAYKQMTQIVTLLNSIF